MVMQEDVPKIFISYRREDSADVTGRIGDKLREHFGKESVFTDVDDIPLGVDFRTHLDNEVSQCDVLLTVIGKDWLSAKFSDGDLRLNNPSDFVRIEIESALRRNIPVIPLLVRGATIPTNIQLPETIKELAFRNAQKIRPDPDFKNDANRLIDVLVKHFESNRPEQISTAPHSLECSDNLQSSSSQWQLNKILGLGVIASIAALVITFYWPRVARRQAEFVRPDMVEIPASIFTMGSKIGGSSNRQYTKWQCPHLNWHAMS